jgi:hypothetical protein
MKNVTSDVVAPTDGADGDVPCKLGRKRGRARLWLEILVLVSIKICILLVIKKMWFSDPVAKKMEVPQPKIEQQLLGASSQESIVFSRLSAHSVDVRFQSLRTS